MKMNEEYPNSDFSDGYTSPDNRFHLSLVKEGFSTEEEMTLLEQIMIHYYKVATSSKCKKYFGFKPDSSYNYEKIARSINFNNLDVNDSDMCFVYSIFSMQKMTTISPLIGNAKYIVETEDYCGFISENYLEGKDDGKDNCIISFDMYSTDDLNMQYNISFIINDYTEEDIETAYAIINSLEMK